MKSKNHTIYADDETLARLKAEYDFIGRPNELQEGRLVVFALPPKRAANQKGAGRGARRGR